MILSRTFIFSIIPGIAVVILSEAKNLDTNEMFRSAQHDKNVTQQQYIQQKVDSADIIVNKYLNALGGLEKLESIHSIYLEGSMNIRGQKTVSKTWIVNAKEYRSESTINGFTSWSIVRTDSGWSYNPNRGQKAPEPFPAERVKIAQNNLDINGPLVDYKKKGYTLEYKGTDQIEGSDVFKIEVKVNAITTKTYYIDEDSYLVIRVRSKFSTATRVNYSNTDYSNYKKTAEGYMFPMQINNLKYSLIQVNPEINDNLFIPKK